VEALNAAAVIFASLVNQYEDAETWLKAYAPHYLNEASSQKA
jgi:hypothetical protein